MKILLINPWICDLAAYDYWSKPLGLLYIGSVLRSEGHSIYLIDCLHTNGQEMAENKSTFSKKPDGRGKYPRRIIQKPEVYRDIPRRYGIYGIPDKVFIRNLQEINGPDYILVTSIMTYWYPGVQHTIRLTKEIFPDIPVILGGIYATLCTEHAVKYSGSEIVLPGPFETAKDEVLKSFFNPDEMDFNDFPFPVYDLYPSLDYAAVLTSRGCPFHCDFCASRKLFSLFRQRDPLHVVEEIEYYFRNLNVKNIVFYDDALLVNKDNHLSIILEEVIKRNIKVNFHTPNGIHVSEVDREISQLMYRSGFKTIRMSLESFDPHVLKWMSKKVSREIFSKAVCFLEKAGYNRHELEAYLLVGLPGQRKKGIIEDIEFVISEGVSVRLAYFSPIPGTSRWEEALNLLNPVIKDEPLISNNTAFPILSGMFSFEELCEIKNYVAALNRNLISSG